MRKTLIKHPDRALKMLLILAIKSFVTFEASSRLITISKT